MKYKILNTRYKILFLIIAFGIFGLAQKSQAAGDIYVDSSAANDNGTGAIGSPLKTIAHALTHITDSNGGWNIILRGGTYYEHDIYISPTKTGTSSAWNSIHSYPGEWAVIDGQHNCTAGAHSVIYTGLNMPSGVPSDYAQYWIIERLGITGGGLDAAHGGGGGETAGGIWWCSGPVTVRYCEIYDNVAIDQNENPAGFHGGCARNNIIEYNYFHDNGTTGTSSGNDREICTTTQEQMNYGPNSSGDIANWGVRDNIIRYTYVVAAGTSVGIGMKASNRLTETSGGARPTTDYTYRNNGDQIYGNIVKDASYSAIFWQNDWAQIHNNICDVTSSGGDLENGVINTRRIRTDGVDTIYPSVYNNTVIGGYQGIGGDFDGKYFNKLQLFIVNNIADSQAANGYAAPISACGDDGNCYPWSNWSWSSGWSFPSTGMDISGVKIDRNYIYRNSNVFGTVFFGKRERTSGGFYSTANFESTYSVDLFEQATQEAGSNKLYAGTSGANKYITVGTHNLGETGKTIANSGIGIAHPYLSGVTIPSYVGATNPSDISTHNWVSGVLNLSSTYFTTVSAGSTPGWIEGSTSGDDTTAPASPSGLSVS